MLNLAKTSRDRVYGFLRTDGTRIVNERGEEVLLTGMGLGNWLLWEGYMWRFYGRYDRPRTIETLLCEVAGEEYTADFIRRFRETYITKEDVRLMAEEGFNSVRVPIGWRVLMDNAPGYPLREDGFALLDRFIDWCEEYKLYVILDLHGAPGGQTGANIDDCFDDRPRLFTDPESYEAALKLWRALAERYKDRWIVGAYDLLNEPLRPCTDGRYPRIPDYRHDLAQFYRDAIAEIRKIDTKHTIQVEGRNWASKSDIFDSRWDDNLVIHFPRYWCRPDAQVYHEFLHKSKELDVPLYLGETGENQNEWYAAMYPLALSLDIGWNIWPWKKMDCTNSPYSVKTPDGWAKLQRMFRGGERPSFAEAQASLESYLENMKAENCDYNPAVTASFYRRPGCSFYAVDFDERPGKGTSYYGEAIVDCAAYRTGSGMRLIAPADTKGEWGSLDLMLAKGEWAEYSVSAPKTDAELAIEGVGGEVCVTVGETELAVGNLPMTVKIPAGEGEYALRITAKDTARMRKMEYR